MLLRSVRFLRHHYSVNSRMGGGCISPCFSLTVSPRPPVPARLLKIHTYAYAQTIDVMYHSQTGTFASVASTGVKLWDARTGWWTGVCVWVRGTCSWVVGGWTGVDASGRTSACLVCFGGRAWACAWVRECACLTTYIVLRGSVGELKITAYASEVLDGPTSTYVW